MFLKWPLTWVLKTCLCGQRATYLGRECPSQFTAHYSYIQFYILAVDEILMSYISLTFLLSQIL
jgi:hypothetical protein